jgi:hypothetical protein
MVRGRRRLGGGGKMIRDVLTSRMAATFHAAKAGKPGSAEGRTNERDRYDRLTKGRTPARHDVVVEPAPDETVDDPQAPRAGVGGRRIDRRTQSILAVAAAAAVAVNAGAAWAYWEITGSATDSRAAGTAVELSLRARSDYNKPLTAGHTGNLTVTLTNDYDFPVKISRVLRGNGKVVADDEHSDAGCAPTGVSMTREEFDVAWSVQKNTIGAFTIPNGLTMAADAKPECVGATFTLPVRVTGFRQTR